MKKLFIIALTLFFIAGMAGVSGANLLENGDFEDVDHIQGISNNIYLDEMSGTQWDVYTSLPGGWQTYSGPGIEIQNNTVVDAHSPNKYVELDSHSAPNTNSTMYQEFEVETTAEHFVSFWYQPRTSNVDDNGIQVSLGDDKIIKADKVRNANSDWTEYTMSLGELTAGETYKIYFAAVGNDNQLGGFIDDIAVNPVPEPGTIILFGAGIIGLVGVRRKFKK